MFSSEGTGTRMTLTYRISGPFSMDSAKLAPIVDGVMRTQLERLAAYSGSDKVRH